MYKLASLLCLSFFTANQLQASLTKLPPLPREAYSTSPEEGDPSLIRDLPTEDSSILPAEEEKPQEVQLLQEEAAPEKIEPLKEEQKPQQRPPRKRRHKRR